MMHAGLAPSPWVVRFARLIKSAGKALDLACGSGRHSRLLLETGLSVLAVDRDLSKIQDMSAAPGLKLLQIDLENGSVPAIFSQDFDAVVVTDYLHRPLLPYLCTALQPGGVLIYETFAQGNEAYGRPTRRDFLLEPGELLRLVEKDLQVVAFEQGLDLEPRKAVRQRICAVNGWDVAQL